MLTQDLTNRIYRSVIAAVGIALTMPAIAITSHAVKAADFLYIGDSNDNTIKRFDAKTGQFLGVFVTSTSSGTQPGQPIIGPRGLIFNRQGNLVLANQNVGQAQNGTILSYSGTTGVFLGALVPFTDPNSPVAPRGIVLGGNLFVASDEGEDGANDGKLRAYTKNGRFISELNGPPGFVGGNFHPRAVVIGPAGCFMYRMTQYSEGSEVRFCVTTLIRRSLRTCSPVLQTTRTLTGRKVWSSAPMGTSTSPASRRTRATPTRS